MAVLLPTSPLPKSAVPRALDYGGAVKSPLGGPSQRLNRLGDRFALDVTTPGLMPEPHGRIWAARLRMAKREGALFPFPQPGFNPGAPGNPVVDGGGQSGLALTLRSFTPGYLIREGQFFNIIHGGRRYIHSASADVLVSGAGTALLPIEPMLRIVPANGALCDFLTPLIQGSLSGNEVAWEQVIARTRPISFSIEEDQ